MYHSQNEEFLNLLKLNQFDKTALERNKVEKLSPVCILIVNCKSDGILFKKLIR